MTTSQSVYTTRAGEFRTIYRALARKPDLRRRTPVVFCEGDSWFSTPLSMNILDWLVYPSPEDEERGVPIFGRGGLFFRAEESGDLAMDMFAPKRLRRLMRWYGGFDFDIALLSAGGNDFVDDFLKETFPGRSEMTVSQAFDVVVRTGRFDAVYEAYARALSEMIRLRPRTPIIGHTYCYPQLMGVPAKLTIANLGAAALLKNNAGPWIGNRMKWVLPHEEDQRQFARMLIDGFAERVLIPLTKNRSFKNNFRFVELREYAQSKEDWFDEMHPKGSSFHRLSRPFADEINALFLLRQ